MSRPLRVAAASLVAAAVLSSGCAPLPPSAPLPSFGRAARFSAPDDAGDLRSVPGVTANAMPGGRVRATIVELWAPTCEPCRRALPALAAETPRLQADGIECVLVAVLDGGESLDEARAALRSWGVGGGFLVDRGRGLQRALGVGTLPAALVLDRAGVVRWVAPAGAPAALVARAARAVADRQSRE